MLCPSLLLLLLVFPSLCAVMKCGDSRSLDDTELCALGEDVTSNGKCELKTVRMEVTDNSTGEVSVTFNVSSTSCSEYEFKLELVPNIDEEDCANSTNVTSDTHSIRYLKLNNETEEHCSEKQSVTFKRVYKGCYQLTYCTVNKGYDCKMMRKYLNSNLTVAYQEPKIVSYYIKHWNKVNVRISNYTQLNKIEISIWDHNISNCKAVNTASRNFVTAMVSRNDVGKMTCERYSCLSSDKNVPGLMCTDIECSEEEDNDGLAVSCYFKDIPSGNYCVTLNINESICGKRCSLHQSLVVPDIGVETSPLPQKSDELLLVAGIIGGLLMVSVIAMIFLWVKRDSPVREMLADSRDNSCTLPFFTRIWVKEFNPRRLPASPERVTNMNLPQASEILLLYPRDCNAFMDTMAMWRKILHEKTGYQVHDCFDPDQKEAVSRSGVDWMRRLVSCNSVQVIVVETTCASLHRRVLLECHRISYKNPTWLDNVFSYGLKSLSDNGDRNNYHRIFVVRLEGFTREEDSLNDLTPYRRYLIPQYLDVLLRDLNVHARNTSSEGMNESLQRFQNNLTNLVNFKTQNPDYLHDLLYIEQNTEC